MPASRIEYLSVTFQEDVAFGPQTITAGTTCSLQKDIARGLDKSVRINGAGSPSSALIAGAISPLSVVGPLVVGGVLNAVLAGGWAATGYQWTRNGVPISGATSAAYTVGSADGGTSVNCIAIGLSYAAVGGPIAGGTGQLAYDGGTAFSSYLGEAIDGGVAGSSYVLPPISGGTA